MTETTTKCTYCGKPAEKVVKREIHDRSRDPYTNRPCVRTRTMEFCSAECGGRYQMGAKADDITSAHSTEWADGCNQPQTLEVAMSDWIKVTDAMPEAPVDVQVYCSDTKEQFVAFHDKTRKQFTYAMDHEGNRIGCIPTHWKPLGPAPTE